MNMKSIFITLYLSLVAVVGLHGTVRKPSKLPFYVVEEQVCIPRQIAELLVDPADITICES